MGTNDTSNSSDHDSDLQFPNNEDAINNDGGHLDDDGGNNNNDDRNRATAAQHHVDTNAFIADAEAEGYTPLNDGSVADGSYYYLDDDFMAGSSSSSVEEDNANIDGESDLDNNEDGQVSEGIVGLARRPGSIVRRSDDNSWDPSTISTLQSTILVPTNHNDIARNALQQLENDYASVNNGTSYRSNVCEDENESHSIEEWDATTSDYNLATWSSEPMTSPEAIISSPLQRVTCNSDNKEDGGTASTSITMQNAEEEECLTDSSHAATERIQRVMEAIRIKSPKLTFQLDTGWEHSSPSLSSFYKKNNKNNKESCNSNSNNNSPNYKEVKNENDTHQYRHRHHHWIIPSAPLSAFHLKNEHSIKAITATENLTYSATLSECIMRIFGEKEGEGEGEGEGDTTEEIGNLVEQRHYPTFCQQEKPLLRPPLQQSANRNNKVLTIHIVGVDHVECANTSRVQSMFCPFVRWLNASLMVTSKPCTTPLSKCLIKNITEVRLLLIGPNIPTSMSISTQNEEGERRINLLPKVNSIHGSRDVNKNEERGGGAEQKCLMGGLCRAYAISVNSLYHDYVENVRNKKTYQADAKNSEEDRDCFNVPDLVIAYNAGIWGYPSWIPTLECLATSENKIPFIVTSYTLEEALDDADTINGVLLSGFSSSCESESEEANLKTEIDRDTKSDIVKNSEAAAISQRDGAHVYAATCIWKPEENYFRSKKERMTVTAVEGRQYYANKAYQAFLVGGGRHLN